MLVFSYPLSMMNLKKPLLFALLLAVAVSPLIPFVRANDGQWKSPVAVATWDYDLYRVDRLSFGKTIQGPFEFNDGVFLTEQAASCKYPATCTASDLTFLKDGKTLRVSDVQPRVSSAFWHSAQDGRFVYVVPSTDKKSWATVYEYDSQTGTTKTLYTIERKADELNYLASAVDGDRVYSSILHKDKTTSDIKTKLVVYDTKTKYTRDDFTWNLNAPWQEILDVREDVVLAKFGFDGGFTQLILMNEKERTVKDIPGTWTAPDGSLTAAHFLPDGTVQYFQNYRLYTYKPGEEKAMESGGAYLNWFMPAEKAVQFTQDRMAYIDPENTLYVTSASGASSFGKALSGTFTLDADTVYFESLNGPVSYTFSTKTWKNRSFRVTDSYKDILVGVDAKGNIWYENTSSGKLINVGFGSEPVLTDREHAIWKGTDGNIYQVTFSSILDLGQADVEAYKAYDSKTVYLKSGSKMWRVTDATTYFTWFDSWNAVTAVSSPTLKVYLDGSTFMGDAPLAPGTRVKANNSPKVYVSGSDGSLHWIVSEAVADSIYGSAWNQGILEVTNERLWNYAMGAHINSNQDVKVI